MLLDQHSMAVTSATWAHTHANGEVPEGDVVGEAEDMIQQS